MSFTSQFINKWFAAPLRMITVFGLTVAACGDDATDSSNTATTTDTGTTTGDVGSTCESNDDCQADNFCNLKGIGCDEPPLYGGTCEPRPTDCAEVEPVCACDGSVYPSTCHAQSAGVDVQTPAPSCTAPGGTFQCGSIFCGAGSHCELTQAGDAFGAECATNPDCQGGAVTCECLALESCGETGTAEEPAYGNCSESDGAITLNCPGEI